MRKQSKRESQWTNELSQIADGIENDLRGTRGKKRQKILESGRASVDSVLASYDFDGRARRRLNLSVLFDTLKVVLGRNKNRQRKDLGNWPEA